MIDSTEISVIVQGAVDREHTVHCLASIRSSLPGAEIVLSTWSGSDVSGFDFDTLILSDDPGAQLLDRSANAMNNVNRQIVSTCAGLRVAGHPYALKFRTDLKLVNVDFLDYFGKYDTETIARYFSNRVLICSFWTRNPRILPLPFHPSDWIAFGNTTDLKTYYDIPLQSDTESAWFNSRTRGIDCYTGCLCRFVPEQYICTQFIKKQTSLACENYYDVSNNNMMLTERFFAENIVVLDYGIQCGIHFLKYNPNRYGDRHNILQHKDWLVLYRKYCHGHSGVFWWTYLTKCQCKKIFSYWARAFVVHIMGMLGIKERVKGVLRKLNG